LLAQLGQDLVPKNCEEPGAERAAGGVVLRGAGPEAQEDVLDDLLGPGLPQAARSDGVDNAGVTVVHLGEGGHVPGRDERNQGFVGGLSVPTVRPVDIAFGSQLFPVHSVVGPRWSDAASLVKRRRPGTSPARSCTHYDAKRGSCQNRARRKTQNVKRT